MISIQLDKRENIMYNNCHCRITNIRVNPLATINTVLYNAKELVVRKGQNSVKVIKNKYS